MPYVTAAYLREFWSPDGLDMHRGGISIPLCKGGRVHLFVRFGMFLADGAAINAMLHAKGASGLKPCPCCQNVFDARSERRSVHGSDWAVLHTEANSGKFILHTAGSITAIINRLSDVAAAVQRGEPMKTELKELQTSHGFTYNANAVLFDKFLRLLAQPGGVVCWDWMHVFLVSGIWQNHAGRFSNSGTTSRLQPSPSLMPTHTCRHGLGQVVLGGTRASHALART